MSKSYNLLCPIARALDAVGDRWSLLILRDLHAGPARFADLQTGLTGIASNLLSTRLTQLADDGLIEKAQAPHNTTLYQLTDLGRTTRTLLFDLARLGGKMQPVEKPKKPGNLRTIAVTLAAALERVTSPETQAEVQLIVDNEPFTISVQGHDVSVLAGLNPQARATLTTSYEALLSAAAGALSLPEFQKASTFTAQDATSAQTTMALLGAAMAQMQ